MKTVYLIMNLNEDTQYEIKARMYSNTGIGPFSEPKIVKTDLGELCKERNDYQLLIGCVVVVSEQYGFTLNF